MKAFAIRDEWLDRDRDLAYLLYYEKEKSFHIEICPDTGEWEAPMILSSFIRKNRRSVDTFWSGKWVEQRIVPPERQNLGMILKKHGIDEYDPYRLLVLSHGRCAQDDCFITALKEREYPAELIKRLGQNIRDMFADE